MASSLSSLLVSLVKENSSEPKSVLIPSMVSFLRENFPFMSENQALVIALKAYENA
jgi:hypothetical protein